MSDERQVGIVLHTGRAEALTVAVQFVRGMITNGIGCHVIGDRADELSAAVGPETSIGRADATELATLGIELVVVFGGDGTILYAAEAVLPFGIPLLGVNLGHVGFLAELESHDVDKLVDEVVGRSYQVEQRLTTSVQVHDASGVVVWESFAINEVSIEKAAREKMLDVLVELDRRPVSRWGCDGMIVATPTGSTAYAFSVGGPVIWPDVQAMLVVPMAAHALFARPMVVNPTCVVDITITDDLAAQAIAWCDGRRSVDLGPGSRIRVERGPRSLLMARLGEQPFTSRLVKKFDLRIDGFRGVSRSDAH